MFLVTSGLAGAQCTGLVMKGIAVLFPCYIFMTTIADNYQLVYTKQV